MKLVYRPKRLSGEAFILKAIDVHGDKYDYSKVNYISNRLPITIICPKHGDFSQIAGKHIYHKAGCLKCANEAKTKTKEFFIKEAIDKFGNFIDYSCVEYVSTIKKVKLICPIHGEFLISPHKHLTNKFSCPKCAREKTNYNTWTFSSWKERAINSYNFDSFKVYVLKCYSSEEVFYKIGKTYTSLENRFKGKSKLPYLYEVIKIYTSADSREISELEVFLHRINKEFIYVPNIVFKGSKECFREIKDLDITIKDFYSNKKKTTTNNK